MLQESTTTNTAKRHEEYTTLISNSRARVEKQSNGKISIFIDGNYFTADENEIANISDNKRNEWLDHFVKYYDELLKKDEEKKSFYKKAEIAVKGALKKAKDWYNSILAMFGVKRYNDIQGDYAKMQEAKEYYGQICDLKMKAVSLGNRYFSACMSAFGHACDKGKFC